MYLFAAVCTTIVVGQQLWIHTITCYSATPVAKGEQQ